MNSPKRADMIKGVNYYKGMPGHTISQEDCYWC